ncbi:super-infection exclusion protein B [Shewanella algae]|uniref:super-infection exclusion protein B n=1 Tax=Shewanella algae TaxID=38313 RepID=UPI001AADA4C6|nr:super-infection exclusion protein B [Shewanella algae]MBO2610080.1 superinfection exclusion B family protein [Shewanella algae]
MLEAKKIFDWLKLSPKQAFILLVLTSILLFGGDKLTTLLGLEKTKELVQPWLGVVWLLCVSLLAAELFIPGFKWAKGRISHLRKMKFYREKLHQLTPEEKVFLNQYIENDTKTVSARYTDGIVQELITNRVIRIASSMSQYGDVFPLNIQPWAWRYLKKKPHLVKIDA